MFEYNINDNGLIWKLFKLRDLHISAYISTLGLSVHPNNYLNLAFLSKYFISFKLSYKDKC